MENKHFLEITINADPVITREIDLGKYHFEKQLYNKAAEHFKDAAKLLLSRQLFNLSIEYYNLASNCYIQTKHYLKAINLQHTIHKIYHLNNNYLQEASILEKIASWYKYYLKDLIKAGHYYHNSAKVHEEKNLNYLSAFKKAKFAYECFEVVGRKRNLIDSLGLATRMAIQSGYEERAGETALKWLSFIKKDYSPHYFSVCMKGYKSFKKTNRLNDAYYFLNEIIIGHFEKSKIQTNIISYLIDAQKIYVQVNKNTDISIDDKIISILGKDYQKISHYFLEMRQLCDSIGLKNISDLYYIKQNIYYGLFLKSNNDTFRYLTNLIWEKTSLYGTSLRRWSLVSFIIILIFGFLYSNKITSSILNLIGFFNSNQLLPSIRITSVDNFFSPFYFSFVTFTTLGFGDITPSNLSAQILIVIEVSLGYLMLGGLISLFTRKIFR